MDNLVRKREFDALVRELSGDLYRFAYWLCKNGSLAQDVLQEAYLRAWKSLQDLRDPKAAKAWMMTIIRREYLRTFERKQLELTELDNALEVDTAAPALDEQSESDQIRQAMLRLDTKYRVPLVLQVIGGLSCAEIALELGLGEAAVMTQLFRARQKLKLMLENKTHAESDHAHPRRA